jgi:hypothetical protein
VSKGLPDRTILDAAAASACLSDLGSPQMTANFATRHEARVSRQQGLEQRRAAATVPADVDQSGQSGLVEKIFVMAREYVRLPLPNR